MQNVYLGRQPILDLYGKLNSYEILYRGEYEQNKGVNNRFVSAAVICSVLNKFGTHAVLGSRKAFAKVDEKFLMSDMIFTIPSQFFIFSIVEADVNERVVERCEQLKERGYELAINDITFDEDNLNKYSSILSTLSYVKINFDKTFKDDEYVKNIISGLKDNNIKVVATKIENDEKYLFAKSLGCELFQGYFFAKPKILESEKHDPSQMNILKLYSLLMEDTNIDEITSEFEKNHALTIQLLRYINSSAFHFKDKISSIHHILTLVGRTPLAQWLMLMIYSKSVAKKGDISPLLLMVKHRTDLMQTIFKKIEPYSRSNVLGQAYFVGVLSLIDTVFGEKLEKILDDMNVDDTTKLALLDDGGLLGEIYALVRDVEQFKTKNITLFEKKHNLENNTIERLMFDSMSEVTAFENAFCSI
ncbi:EAL and HDOD domain-containing protein [Candidatus Sulfurimonas baltica]|uniref:EAL domain-containing protein n=1 Tax=Candidatus Sulfurimonas baltica TaxID=2740404 RepID=A0A7S7RNA6_9BACT|nr:EAL domain-containing protein [Candidatus Sulfurimonas baltica]QOY52228.1 EAL domain-containing protein [Candidatus Sulfurimonas baltica]